MKRAPSVFHKVMATIRDEGPHGVAAKAESRIQFFWNTMRASRRFRSLSHKPMSIAQSLDLAFGFSIGEVSVAPAQIRSEIESLLELLTTAPPRRVLEIGTARGGTLFLLSRVAGPGAVIATIDLPGGDFGSSYRRESIVLLKRLALEGQRLQVIRADSHQPATLARVRRVFGRQPLDALLIDGDHRYEGIRADLAMYGPLVRPGGHIAIHDIVPGPPDRVGGVPRLWNEIKALHRSEEFVHDWQQEGFGIGVLEVPTEGLDSALVNH